MLRSYVIFARRPFCSTPSRENYYRLLGLSESFAVDEKQLSANYKQLQRQWHPDKFGRKPMHEQKNAEAMSANINEAYNVLSTPYRRAKHLLALRTSPDDSSLINDDTDDDVSVELEPAFLMWVVEFRESISEAAGIPDRLHSLREEARVVVQQCLTNLSGAFEAGALDEAAVQTAKLQYLRRIERAIDDHMEH